MIYQILKFDQFQANIFFHVTLEHQKTSYFLMFSGDIEREQWPEMVYESVFN